MTICRWGSRSRWTSVKLLPPVPDPTKIFAAPVNYRDHQEEMNEAVQVSGLGLFLKSPSSLIGHKGQVQLPYTDRRFDHEGRSPSSLGDVPGTSAEPTLSATCSATRRCST